jgi:alpha-glucoside transport system permease protein
VSSAGNPTAPPPAEPALDAGGGSGRWRKYALAAGFLAPAIFFLGIWIVYPTIRTIYRSFFDRSGDEFVGLDNYVAIFERDTLFTAVQNNFFWLMVVPAAVTAIGLVFAVLLERIRWSVAFKTAVFMPMAISAFAAGITWRIVYIQDPEQGALNAAIAVVKDTVSQPGVLSQAAPSSDALVGSESGGLRIGDPISTGDTALLGLTRIRASEVPESAEQAVVPEAGAGEIAGVVWRDFKPGGGTPGEVERGELGLPDVTIDLRDPGGRTIAETVSENDGTFRFENLEQGQQYLVAIGPETFNQPFEGVAWLGPDLVTPSIMISYIWIWAGFAMVVIGAGLAAMPRDVLEAARTDGGTEWQIFRRVTVPLLWPILTVVFVTMLINVLKVFDIVISIAPGSVQDDATVLALSMWREAFTGQNDFGVGSAIAVFIFVLVIPILMLNIRNFRRES